LVVLFCVYLKEVEEVIKSFIDVSVLFFVGHIAITHQAVITAHRGVRVLDMSIRHCHLFFDIAFDLSRRGKSERVKVQDLTHGKDFEEGPVSSRAVSRGL